MCYYINPMYLHKQTSAASQRQLVDQHLDHSPTQQWPLLSLPAQTTMSVEHRHAQTFKPNTACVLYWLHIMCVTYQNSLTLLWIWIFHCGEFRIWIFLFLYSIWRVKVKGLESWLDKRMADAMDRCMHNFHIWILVYVPVKITNLTLSTLLSSVLDRYFNVAVQVVICVAPVMAVFLDVFEVLCVDVLVWIFE